MLFIMFPTFIFPLFGLFYSLTFQADVLINSVASEGTKPEQCGAICKAFAQAASQDFTPVSLI